MKVIAESTRTQQQRRGIRLFLSLMAAFLMACTTAAPTAKPIAGKGANYTCPDNSFTAIVPKDWEMAEREHPYGDLTKISGVRLISPVTPEGAPVTISILHYSGEHLFRTPDEFIHDKLNSIARIDFDREAPITEIKIGGRQGKTFQIKSFDLIYLHQLGNPPMQEGVVYEIVPPHKQIDMLEQWIIIPASKGYFVMGYRSPVKLVEEFQGVFETVVGSFHPLLP